MKKLHKLVLTSFLGPFVLTFFIAIFTLLMQFLWKYIDDLVGKGLEWYVIAELLLYASASLVPLALPLATLLSSIMTMGSFGENYELAACKSAGVSLLRLMLPMILIACCIAVIAFFFSNRVLPYANLKMGSLLYDVRQQKPALHIKEGVFYNGIDGYVIKVGEKEQDGQTLKDIMIYDHTDMTGNRKVLKAESGKMAMSADDRYLILSLFNGKSYEERNKLSQGTDTHPLVRSSFSEQEIRFDLSAFQLTRTNEELFKDHHQMLNISQLTEAKDTLKKQLEERKQEFKRNMNHYFFVKRESPSFTKKNSDTAEMKPGPFFENFSNPERMIYIESAQNIARSLKSYAQSAKDDFEYRQKNITRHQIEYYRKFTLSVACLVLFFIGAPLGAIIRKGGLGLPVVFSILFFILFHIISITGEKFAKEGVITAFEGMWLSSAVILPFGIYLTYMATTDSAILTGETYNNLFRNLKKKLSKRN